MNLEAESPNSGSFAVDPGIRATVEEMTARLVNQAVSQRLQQAAREEEERARVEQRVWRMALAGLCLLGGLGLAVTVLSHLHLL